MENFSTSVETPSASAALPRFVRECRRLHKAAQRRAALLRFALARLEKAEKLEEGSALREHLLRRAARALRKCEA